MVMAKKDMVDDRTMGEMIHRFTEEALRPEMLRLAERLEENFQTQLRRALHESDRRRAGGDNLAEGAHMAESDPSDRARHAKNERYNVLAGNSITAQAADLHAGSRRELVQHENEKSSPRAATYRPLSHRMSHAMSNAQESHQSPTGEWNTWLANIVNSHTFGVCMCAVVLANAMVMAVEVDVNLRRGSTKEVSVFLAIDLALAVIFFLDFVLRRIANGSQFWTTMNALDALVVVMQVLEIVLRATVKESAAISFLRAFRFLRTVRIIRLGGLYEFLELRMLITTIGSCVRSLGWTVLLLLLATFAFSLHLGEIVSKYLDQTKLLEFQGADAELILPFYGNFGTIMYSLFQTVSNGLDWSEMVRPLTRLISPLAAVSFAIYIVFMVFAFLNVITGVFLNAAIVVAEDDKRRVMARRIRKMFEEADSDNSGEVSFEEFKEQMSSPKMKLYLKAMEFLPEQAEKLYMLLDSDKSGGVSIQEFVTGCIRLQGSVKAVDFAAFYDDYRRWTTRLEADVKKLAEARH